MAKLILDYYEPSTDDVYSDGEIEYELLQYAKSGECDWYQDGRWPVIYHMSHLRHNILNWFPFKENCSILEIGAGCGALTGLLCERATKVVAVELTKRRAEVNFHRHQHFDNLDIVVCDFQSIPSEWKFDYVIINGVLEYAAYMIRSEQPYEDFLKISAEYLNPKGRILLSIENRLGLKYISGAKEDHTGKYFSGVNGYIDGEKVKTFSKDELCEQISNARLSPLKFYYPYPDYKFPAEIFTDETVCNMIPSVSNYPMDMPRTKLFEEKSVYQSFMKLGIMDKLSNSFLVEIAIEPKETPAEMTYVKLSANRNENFRICTYFDADKKRVHKQALSPYKEEHLNNMKRFSGYNYGPFTNTVCQEESKGLSFPYITGETLENNLLNAYKREDLDEFVTQIKQFRDGLFEGIEMIEQPYSLKFEEIFGNRTCQLELHWTDNANVDLIAGNIFIADNSYQVIDYEWHVQCKVPQEFVVWRMLKQIIEDHHILEYLTKSMLYDLININQATEECFSDWEFHFAKEYVGIKDLYHLAKDIVPIDVERAVTHQLQESVLQSTLFLDLGNGFTDVNYDRSNAVYSSDGFSVTFSHEMLNKAKMLRWDPLEGSASSIQIQKIETDGTFISVEPINAERYIEDIGYEFFTYDPQFQLAGEFSDATYIKVLFTCNILDWTQGYRKREEEIILYESQLSAMGMELKFKHGELQKTQKDLLNTQNTLLDTQNALLDAQNTLLDTQNALLDSQNTLQHTMLQMKEHRIKTMAKVLLYGGLTRRKSGE